MGSERRWEGGFRGLGMNSDVRLRMRVDLDIRCRILFHGSYSRILDFGRVVVYHKVDYLESRRKGI